MNDPPDLTATASIVANIDNGIMELDAAAFRQGQQHRIVPSTRPRNRVTEHMPVTCGSRLSHRDFLGGLQPQARRAAITRPAVARTFLPAVYRAPLTSARTLHRPLQFSDHRWSTRRDGSPRSGVMHAALHPPWGAGDPQIRRITDTTLPRTTASSPSITAYAGLRGSRKTWPSRRRSTFTVASPSIIAATISPE
jgi:hypothetical protein